MKQNILLAIQILCIVFLLFTGPLVVPVIVLILMQVLGVLMIIWSILAIRQNKKTTPKLPRGYFFVTTGPYEIIRHPISASLFFLTFPLVQAELTALRAIIFVTFIVTTVVKTFLEEAFMGQNIKEYADYQTRTKKLIPYVF